MSEWRGLHNPDWHSPTSIMDMSWCGVCDDACYSGAPCCCCLAAEVKRLTAELAEARAAKQAAIEAGAEAVAE